MNIRSLSDTTFGKAELPICTFGNLFLALLGMPKDRKHEKDSVEFLRNFFEPSKLKSSEEISESFALLVNKLISMGVTQQAEEYDRRNY